MARQRLGGFVVDLLRRKPLDPHGHDDRHLDLVETEISGGDLAGEARAGIGRRIGDDRGSTQDAVRLQRDQFRVAGAKAEAVEFTGHEDRPSIF